MRYFEYSTFWTWSGVDLFFILSGFLIGRSLLFNKASRNYFKTFYARRIFRIFPAYYLALLLFFILLLSGLSASFPWLMQDPCPLYSYVLYIQNFWMVNRSLGANWLAVTWSLAIEEQFYLILPLLIFVLNEKHLVRVLLVCIVLAPVCRYLLSGLASYVMLPAQMDSLFTGVLLAYYYLNGKLKEVFTGKGKMLVTIMLLAFAIMTVLGARKGGEEIGGTFIHSIILLLYGAFIILILTLEKDTWLIRFLSTPILSFFSKISYMAYLSHQIISGLLHQLILHHEPGINNMQGFLVTMLALGVTILFSTLSYYYFEKPILNIGKRFKY